MRSEKAASHTTPGWQVRRRADESDGVHRRVLADDSLCFFFAVRARNLSLSASLEWAEEALKRHACLGSILLILPVLTVFLGLSTYCSGYCLYLKYFGVQYSRYCLYLKYFGGQYFRYCLNFKYFGVEYSGYCMYFKYFGVRYSGMLLYLKHFVVRYSGILSVLNGFRDPVLLVL